VEFLILSALAKEAATNHLMQMSDLDFLDWLSLGSIDSIEMALIHFEELDSVEGYLKCAIIRDYLKVIT
jgi:hypothetical protein